MSDDKRKSFEELVGRYGEQLYWHVRRMVVNHDDADDLVQNTFLKAWNSFDSFRNDSQASTWLYRIAYNETLDFLRKQKVRSTVDADAADDALTASLVSDPYFDGDETQRQLQEAISRLPDVQRQVFNMRYFDEMSYKDISEITGTSEGALKASYHIAVKKISEYFNNID